jgi:hypothetical protein
MSHSISVPPGLLTLPNGHIINLKSNGDKTSLFSEHSYQEKYQKFCRLLTNVTAYLMNQKGVLEQELYANNCGLKIKDTWKLFDMTALSYKRWDNKICI